MVWYRSYSWRVSTRVLASLVPRTSRPHPVGLACLLLTGVCAVAVAGTDTAVAEEPGVVSSVLSAARDGHLVVVAAADSTAGFAWVRQPERARRLLVWPAGVLSVPDSLEVSWEGSADLVVPTLAGLRGFSGTRGLAFLGGSYAIETPLLLDDGRIQLFAAAGELEIGVDRLVYRSRAPALDGRSSYLFMAAILILSLVLLARVRSRTRRR